MVRDTQTQGIEIRAARPEEAEAVLETLCAAFELSLEAARPIFYADPYYDLSHKRVLTLPNVGVVSCLTLVPTTLRLSGVPIEAGGVAGVATRPAFQRRGYAAALLAATVPAVWAELGYPISLLHALSAPFYQQFGWEYASHQIPWLTTPASLPHSVEADHVRPVQDTDWPAIFRLHEELTHHGTGACERDLRRWSLIQLPVPGRETVVYEAGGAVTGYGIWERRETLQVLELQGSTDTARQGLLGYLARQPDSLLEWVASPAILRQFGLTLPAVASEPGVMLRIADLEAALRAVHGVLYAPVLASVHASLTLMATDALCPQNTRPLRLTADGIAVGSPEDLSWLRADIQTLGPLYLGAQTPSEAHALGQLHCDSPETLALADRLFPARQPYVAPLDQF